MIKYSIFTRIKMFFNRNTYCPICGYTLGYCQCCFGGSAHPNRDRNAEIVKDHLYLLSRKQLKHLIKLEKYWQTSYGDEERQRIYKALKELDWRHNR